MLASTQDVAEKYAQALFELAEEENISGKVGEDINALSAVFLGNGDLKAFFGNPGVNKAARADAAQKIFAGRVEGISLNFIMLLAEKRLEGVLPLVARQFRALLYARDGIIEARVTTARELSEDERADVARRLGAKLARPVVLDTRVDKNIIGGIIIQIGDKLIDGSISQRLKKYGQLLSRVNTGEKGVAGAV